MSSVPLTMVWRMKRSPCVVMLFWCMCASYPQMVSGASGTPSGALELLPTIDAPPSMSPKAQAKLEKELSDCRSQSSSLAEKTKALEQASQAEVAKLKAAEQQVKEAGKEQSSLESQLRSLQEQVSRAERERDEGAKALQEAKKENKSLTARLQKKETELESVSAGSASGAASVSPGSSVGSVLSPEMVSIPAGSFRMGCLESDKQCKDDEKPAHEVSLSSFAIGKYEVTFEMWDACYAQGGCDKSPDDEGWGRGTRPVMNVSWNDIQKFLVWMKAKTGKNYRLPTEAEWEYAARAGSRTIYSWGDDAGKNRANCDGCGSQWDIKQTAPVGSFGANPWGFYDMHGNVREWCSDWYVSDYYQKSPGQNPQGPSSGSDRVVRGGGWYFNPGGVRAAGRFKRSPDFAESDLGFRLVLPSSASGK